MFAQANGAGSPLRSPLLEESAMPLAPGTNSLCPCTKPGKSIPRLMPPEEPTRAGGPAKDRNGNFR